jgi:aryl-alcohol dehydrogenase-like predicted oxidoreductase
MSISRRGFVSHAAAAGAGGVLSNLLDGRTESLQAETTSSSNTKHSPIPTRPFGHTGAEISIVGFGAGSRFYTSTPDDETGAELIRAAVDQGITLVETGSNYGGDEGISERRIGLAMTTHRSKAFLETKVDERDYDGAMREMERSMVRMNTDYLDLVLHHFLRSTEEVAEVAGPNGAEKAIRAMVDEGVVRSRGVSTHTPEVAAASLEQLDPEAIQLPINAVRVPDFEAGTIAAAREQGVSIIAMKTCGNGFFFPANATTPDRIEEYGPPPGAWDRWDLPTWTDYIHYVLSLPIASATIGIDSYFTLEGIVTAAASFEPLSAERMASISEKAQIFSGTGYWIPRDRQDRGGE